jgi:lysosomal acid lipase/cholesteryl ester hydrolase
MGTIVFWIAMSHYPEYNQKIRLMSALAPVAYIKHIKSPVRLLAPFASEAEVTKTSFLYGLKFVLLSLCK